MPYISSHLFLQAVKWILFFLLFVVILISDWLCDALVLLNYNLLDSIEEVAGN